MGGRSFEIGNVLAQRASELREFLWTKDQQRDHADDEQFWQTDGTHDALLTCCDVLRDPAPFGSSGAASREARTASPPTAAIDRAKRCRLPKWCRDQTRNRTAAEADA